MAYVISDSCVSCGTCEGECPVGAISAGDGKYEIAADTCIECGTCAGACPTGAISQELFSYLIQKKLLVSPHSFFFYARNSQSVFLVVMPSFVRLCFIRFPFLFLMKQLLLFLSLCLQALTNQLVQFLIAFFLRFILFPHQIIHFF